MKYSLVVPRNILHILQDENDWLREELEDTEKRLEDALSRLAQLEEEKKHWDFMEETRRQEKEATLKPVTPSKIPVGSFRVEEEKAITRALNGQADSNRAASPPPPSRIPKFFKASNYMKVKVKCNHQYCNKIQMKVPSKYLSSFISGKDGESRKREVGSAEEVTRKVSQINSDPRHLPQSHTLQMTITLINIRNV